MRFGLVGTGYWAKMTHAPALASTPGAELTAVWGRDPAATAALAAACGARAHQDIDAFLASVDAVAFAVPPHVQAPLAIRAAQAGKHLLLEKPVTLSVDDADRLVAAVDEAGVASVVFFTWRFNTEIRAWLTDEQARGGWSARGLVRRCRDLARNLAAAGQPVQHPVATGEGRTLGPRPAPRRHAMGLPWPRHRGDRRGGQGGRNPPGAAARHRCDVHGDLHAERPGGGRRASPSSSGARPAARSCPWTSSTRSQRCAPPPPSSSRWPRPVSTAHPCDVRFGREITRVLAAAQAQL